MPWLKEWHDNRFGPFSLTFCLCAALISFCLDELIFCFFFYFLLIHRQLRVQNKSVVKVTTFMLCRFWKWVFKHLFTNILVLSLSLADQNVPISWPQRGDISFENVSLRYEGQRQNVIGQLNLKIPAGQRVSAVAAVGNKLNHSSYCMCMFLCLFVCVCSASQQTVTEIAVATRQTVHFDHNPTEAKPI